MKQTKATEEDVKKRGNSKYILYWQPQKFRKYPDKKVAEIR